MKKVNVEKSVAPDLAISSVIKKDASSLDKATDTESLFQIIVLDCLDKMEQHDAGIFPVYQQESMHQFRVSLRRLRTVFQLFKDEISIPPSLKDELVWIAREIGPARDWDVLVASTLTKITDSKESRRSARRVIVQAGHYAEKQHQLAIDALRSERFELFILNLAVWLFTKSWRDEVAEKDDPYGDTDIRKFCNKATRKIFKRLFSIGKKTKHKDAERLHRVRIAVKKAHYSMEFFWPFISLVRKKSTFEDITTLQSGLGNLNDMVVADRLLDDLLKYELDLSSDIDTVRHSLNDLRASVEKNMYKELARYPIFQQKAAKIF